jgi:hypothetical protein
MAVTNKTSHEAIPALDLVGDMTEVDALGQHFDFEVSTSLTDSLFV